MVKAGTAALVVSGLVLLAACGQKQQSAPQEKEEAPTLHQSMRLVMEAGAETIWDLSSKAYNDVGDGLDATKLSDDDWKKIAEASQAMKERAQLLTNSDFIKNIVVAAPGEQILGAQAAGVKGNIGPEWDAASAEQIKARIEANPALFAQKAQDLVDHAEAMHRAAATKDAALLYKASSELDEVCDACHEPFWGTDEPPPFPKS